MFGRNEEISFEQKIDYIYNDLRSKRRGTMLKWLFRIIIFWLILHFYFAILPTMNKDKIVDEVWNKIIEIVIPIIEKTINNVNINNINVPNINSLPVNKW